MALMQAPVAAGFTFKMPLSGLSYTVDANGFVSVASQADINSLLKDGYILVWGGRNNFTATNNPGVGADVTQDYAPGSIWINQAASPARIWMCVSSATGAAVWGQLAFGDNILGFGTAKFTNLVLTGLQTNSTASTVSAFSGGGQSSATLLADILNTVTTASGSSAPYDSVKLQPATAGFLQILFNQSTNPIQLFAFGSDTINSFAGNVGITVQPKSVVFAFATATATWTTFGSGVSFPVNRIYNTNTATTGTTLTAANITGGSAEVFLDLTGTLAANANAQLPSVASLVAAIPNAKVGQNYKLRVLNNSAGDFTWTVTTNTGWTLGSGGAGVMTIDQGGWRDFFVTLTTLSAATFQSVGASGAVDDLGFATSVVYNTNSATSGTTLTGANISGATTGVTLNMTGALGAGANAQLPTVANLVAAIPDTVAGQSYKLRIINSSSGAFAWTITTNTNWTLSGTMTIAQNTWRDFYVTFTTLSAAVLQQVGTGTNL